MCQWVQIDGLFHCSRYRSFSAAELGLTASLIGKTSRPVARVVFHWKCMSRKVRIRTCYIDAWKKIIKDLIAAMIKCLC